METITVNTKYKRYPIYIDAGFNRLLEFLFPFANLNEKAMIISDTNVSRYYLNEVKGIVSQMFSECLTLTLPAGEGVKSLKTLEDIYSLLYTSEFGRSSCLISLGGGVIGDITGFAAATYKRGVKLIHIPTSLLSQADSSIGGKTAVNFSKGKNIIGAFYQPDMVYINVKALRTLPGDEFISGMGEVIKYGFIKDKNFLEFISENKDGILALDNEKLSYIIKKSCAIKAALVEADEMDNGIREILNFGHTFGHAVESLLNFSIPHGRCVALGMVCALHLSCKRGGITASDYKKGVELLKDYGLPVKIKGLSPEGIYEIMRSDKKVKNNRISFVVLKEIGAAHSVNTVNKEDIIKAIEQIIE
ncbi:MAG: 3-dehydroquinate synthase [Clostridiales bacterium]|jgi:3-dehydroquinate synthase|nr:3-dehydroquinate synthase [Clostridiales bacterium]